MTEKRRYIQFDLFGETVEWLSKTIGCDQKGRLATPEDQKDHIREIFKR